MLNTLRDPKIGFPITIEQYQRLTPAVLLDRLSADPFSQPYPEAMPMANAEGRPPILKVCGPTASFGCYWPFLRTPAP